MILLLPMIMSYLRLRGRERPAAVSHGRIRRITLYSFLLGSGWAVAAALMFGSTEQLEVVGLMVVMFVLIFGSVAMLPSLPWGSIAYIVPIMAASLVAVLNTGLLSFAWLSLLYFGTIFAVGLAMWQSCITRSWRVNSR